MNVLATPSLTARLALRDRLLAAGWHFAFSTAAAALAAMLVFVLWYPGAYRELSGGRELFFLVVAVDVVLGPLLTFAVFDRSKGWSHLRRDLGVIVVLQLAALAYGLHTVYLARPIALVFEVDRFRVVTAAEVHLKELPLAAEPYRDLPLSGPWALAVRMPTSTAEHNSALWMAIQEGVDTSQRPIFWVPYAQTQAQALSRAQPVSELLARHPDKAPVINERLRSSGIDAAQARVLPVVARGDWVAFLDARGDVVGFAPVDGF